MTHLFAPANLIPSSIIQERDFVVNNVHSYLAKFVEFSLAVTSNCHFYPLSH